VTGQEYQSPFGFAVATTGGTPARNKGEIVGKKYAADPGFKEALTEIIDILRKIQQEHPTATEAEAEEIIEAEFEEIRTSQPTKWQKFRRQLLNRERWFNGGKEAVSEVAKHYVEGNVVYKKVG
jgi:hypothetical protein